MPRRFSIGTMLLIGMLAGGDVTGIAAPGQRPEVADKEAEPSVDVELIIAVDVSYSMDLDELAVQREGYAQAIVSKDFLQALRTGPHSKISLTYFEWSASSDQKIIIPWRMIDGPETADAVANEIMQTPVRRGRAPRSPAPSCLRCRCSMWIPIEACVASSTFRAMVRTTTDRR